MLGKLRKLLQAVPKPQPIITILSEGRPLSDVADSERRSLLFRLAYAEPLFDRGRYSSEPQGLVDSDGSLRLP